MCACMWVCAHECRSHGGQKCQIPEAEVTDGSHCLTWVLELNLDPLEEQVLN